jgi:hypothetical protein
MEEDTWEDHDRDGKTSGGELLKKTGPDAGCHAIEEGGGGREGRKEGRKVNVSPSVIKKHLVKAY